MKQLSCTIFVFATSLVASIPVNGGDRQLQPAMRKQSVTAVSAVTGRSEFMAGTAMALDVLRANLNDIPPLLTNGLRSVLQSATAPQVRLPGEFERQQFLLLSCGVLNHGYADTIAEIVRETERHIRTVVLVRDDGQKALIRDVMYKYAVDEESMWFFQVDHNTKWVRDYGPLVATGRGGASVVIDNLYDSERMSDDLVPARIADFKGSLYQSTQLVLEGGNLLSNGQGLCISTTEVLHANSENQLDETDVRRCYRRYFGATTTLFLDPLVGEPTSHVDMFATFTDANTVVVGKYDAKDEPENAAILDRNAKRLAEVETPKGKLRVVRVPMGGRSGDFWRTYTNCIYANGVLLMPVYKDDDPAVGVRAFDTFAKLLPGWRIVPIDCTDLIDSNGALHCISMNIPALTQSRPRFRMPKQNYDKKDLRPARNHLARHSIKSRLTLRPGSSDVKFHPSERSATMLKIVP